MEDIQHIEERTRLLEELETVIDELSPKHRQKFLSLMQRYSDMVESTESTGVVISNKVIAEMIRRLKDR